MARDFSKLDLSSDISPTMVKYMPKPVQKAVAVEQKKAPMMPTGNVEDFQPKPKVPATPQKPESAPAASASGKMSIGDFGKTVKAKYPEYANISDEELGTKMLDKFPMYRAQIAGPEDSTKAPEPKKEGFVLSTLKGIAKPFVTAGVTGVAALDAARRLATGDKAGADKILDEGYNVPGFGQITPVGAESGVKEGGMLRDFKRMVGTGAEIAATIAPATSAVKVGKQGILPAIKTLAQQEAKIGAASGLLSGAGSTLREGGGFGEAAVSGGVGALTGGLLAGALPFAGQAIRGLKKKMGSETLAARFVNSIVKPLSKDFEFGKNPGQTVARYKITGNSFEDLAANIGKTKNEVWQKIETALSSKQVAKKRMDLFPALKSLDEQIEKAASSGNQSLYTRLTNARERITNVFGIGPEGKLVPFESLDFSNLNPMQATRAKQRIGDLIEWTEKKTEDDVTNKALSKVYRSMKSSIEKVVPEVRSLNDDWGNLMTAEKATMYRNRIVQRQNMISPATAGLGTLAAILGSTVTGGTGAALAGLGTLALTSASKSPAIMTRLAAWISRAAPGELEQALRSNPKLRNLFVKAMTQNRDVQNQNTP